MFFFFNDTATTEIYTLSLHDALPISIRAREAASSDLLSASAIAVATSAVNFSRRSSVSSGSGPCDWTRSEEHTSELQSRLHLVCRLLLEKKKTSMYII